MVKLINIPVLLFLLTICQCEATVKQNSSYISYPTTEYNDLCTITENGSNITGKCISFQDCPSAVDLWANRDTVPITCYFDKFDHKICCPENTTASPAVTTVLPETTTFTLRTNPMPKENDSCSLDESTPYTVNGTCQEFLNCPTAFHRWRIERRYPQVCFDRLICCPNAETVSLTKSDFKSNDRKLRRSERECNYFYGPILSAYAGAIGVPAKLYEFPYMVALGWKSDFGDTIDFNCGGVLIAQTFVLTAAHCTSLRGVSPVVVRVGGGNLTDYTSQQINIQKIIDHPNYEANSYHDDIALIELERNALSNPGCIWTSTILEQQNLTALGYGNTKYAGPSSEQLIKAALFEVPNSICAKNYDTGLFDTQLCAGNSKQRMDTCQGDSGGPLLMYRDTTFYPYVVGITSFGNPCGGVSPGIYTRVSSYIDWIEEIVWK